MLDISFQLTFHPLSLMMCLKQKTSKTPFNPGVRHHEKSEALLLRHRSLP
jgi:hypothetical protein